MDNYRFPKYARLTGPDSTLMMRSAISKDGMSATYYRPCGEWGCSIKLRHYEYSSDDNGVEVYFHNPLSSFVRLS